MFFFSCLARAEETTYRYEVYKQEDGAPVCTMRQKGVETKEQFLRIEVTVPVGSKLESASLVKQTTPVEVVSFPLDGISPPAEGGNLAVLTLERAKFGIRETAFLQVQMNTAGAVSSPIDCKTEEGDSVSYFGEEGTSKTGSIDVSALEFWLGNESTLKNNLLKQLKAIDDKEERILLVHLPSGAIASPMDNAVSEGEWIQVAFLLPETEERMPRITSKNCEAVNTFRQKEAPSAKEGADALKERQGAKADERARPIKFKLVPVGQMFRCGAGPLSYEVHPLSGYEAKRQKEAGTTPEAASSSVENVVTARVRPRYHLAATAMVGFDTATTRRFETDSSQLVQEVTDREGLAVYVGATWMVIGVDYEAMTELDYFLNVFAAVKPTSPTEDAVVGLAFTYTGSLSLALGLSLHKNTRLTKGYTVGSSFTGDGDIPTEKTWKGMRPGFFVGFAVDSNIYDALIKRF
ncbi:hypothetical protein K8640_14945 [Myxococcus sp. XM-1-1-1]|uniref:hypothetical protein n=1 Tax=Myxococcus sp. XM-1-1-1 TaxID=2874602 RepID=UPI001CBE04F6|nr:hypothetical protein [Myxococcus sp. XM-1-1-1]MBZ4409519.1 hypothetical protein [Myxococcus sp. XM-1-1-1]